MENPDRSNDRGFLWRSRGEAKEPHSRNPACHETWPLSTRASEAMAAEVAFRMRFCRGTNCGRVFFICGPCYRGQAYCSNPCRREARRQQRKRANRRYEQDPGVRQDHRDRQRGYRERLRLSRVTDQSSMTGCGSGSISPHLVRTDPGSAERVDEIHPQRWRKQASRIICNICGRIGRFVAALIRRV